MGEQPEPCPVCGGRGFIAGPDAFGNYDVCDECEGTGVVPFEEAQEQRSVSSP
jgi:DnaJ-class molecular chaperone